MKGGNSMRATDRTTLVVTKALYQAALTCPKKAFHMLEEVIVRKPTSKASQRSPPPIDPRTNGEATKSDVNVVVPPDPLVDGIRSLAPLESVRLSDRLPPEYFVRVIDGFEVHHAAREWHKQYYPDSVLLSEESFDRSSARTDALLGDFRRAGKKATSRYPATVSDALIPGSGRTMAPQQGGGNNNRHTKAVALNEAAFTVTCMTPADEQRRGGGQGAMGHDSWERSSDVETILRTRTDLLHFVLPHKVLLHADGAHLPNTEGAWELIEVKAFGDRTRARTDTLHEDIMYQFLVLKLYGIDVFRCSGLTLAKRHEKFPAMDLANPRAMLNKMFDLYSVDASVILKDPNAHVTRFAQTIEQLQQIHQSVVWHSRRNVTVRVQGREDAAGSTTTTPQAEDDEFDPLALSPPASSPSSSTPPAATMSSGSGEGPQSGAAVPLPPHPPLPVPLPASASAGFNNSRFIKCDCNFGSIEPTGGDGGDGGDGGGAISRRRSSKKTTTASSSSFDVAKKPYVVDVEDWNKSPPSKHPQQTEEEVVQENNSSNSPQQQLLSFLRCGSLSVTGNHCNKGGLECPFMDKCVPTADAIPNSVFTMPGMKMDMKAALWNVGLREAVQLHPRCPGCDTKLDLQLGGSSSRSTKQRVASIVQSDLSDTQQQYVAAVYEQHPIVNRAAITSFVDDLVYPVIFLDFETASWAVPPFEGVTLYDQVPFQFSAHVFYRNVLTEVPEEFSFLHLGAGFDVTKDPRPTLLKRLYECFDTVAGKAAAIRKQPPPAAPSSINKGGGGKTTAAVKPSSSSSSDKPLSPPKSGLGSIIAHNARFEAQCLKRLRLSFPDIFREKYHESTSLTLVDTLQLCRTSICHPAAEGSWSLKALLPALVPSLKDAYKVSSITDGAVACARYRLLASRRLQPSTQEEIDSLRHDLLQYCRTDTEGLYMVLRAMHTLATAASTTTAAAPK